MTQRILLSVKSVVQEYQKDQEDDNLNDNDIA